MDNGEINPFENNKKINSMDSFSKTPEEEKRFKRLEEQFKEKYGNDLEKLFGDISPENIGKINGSYQNNGGDFKKALESILSKFPLKYKEKKDLEWLIIFYIKKNKAELKKEKGRESLEINNITLKKEHPFVPILERYLEIGILTEEEINSIIENIDYNNKQNIDTLDAIENSNLPPNKKKKLLDVNKYLIKKEITQEKELKSGKKIKLPDIFKQYESLSNKDDDIINLIAIHYIPIKDKDGKLDNKKDINTAILKATNDTIFGKVFNRERMIFKNNFNIIKGDYSIKDKVNALRKIVSFVNSNQGKKGRKASEQNSYFENVDRLKDLSLEEMEIKIKELLQKSKEAENKNFEKQLQTIQKVKKAEQTESGEVFAGGKNDSISNNKNPISEIS